MSKSPTVEHAICLIDQTIGHLEAVARTDIPRFQSSHMALAQDKLDRAYAILVSIAPPDPTSQRQDAERPAAQGSDIHRPSPPDTLQIGLDA